MKCSNPISVKDLANRFGLKLIGNPDNVVYGINEIHKVVAGDLTFVDHEKYYSKSINSAATIILIDKEVDCPEGKTLLVGENPFQTYNTLVLEHRPLEPQINRIAETAIIHPSAVIEAGAVIGHYCVIGQDAYVGANAVIGEFTVIGNRSVVQAGAIIGSDAFYYKKTKEGFKKWRSGGRVIIFEDVEIGAGCTINKGVSGDTIIGDGTKIDCLVHIGHGVVLGKHCLLAGQVGIGGKTIVGNHVTMYGKVGVAQNIIIEDGVTLLAGSGVGKNLEAGKTYFGSPCEEAKMKMREMVALRQLPDWMKEMRK
jgi:UDP-3-O-[3-hydroxymyristoyl] glucosamine N-acyltransferase